MGYIMTRHYFIVEINTEKELELYSKLIRPLLDSDLKRIVYGQMEEITLWKEVNKEALEIIEEENNE